MSGPVLRGLAVDGPQPTAPGATARRTGAVTISSSSAASADEPKTPFGLGDRRLGDVEPEPPVSAAGRAIGAIGVDGIGRPIGPRSTIEGRRPGGPGASCVGDVSGFCAALLGGAIGASGARLRLKPGSKGGPALKSLGIVEGASEGGI